MQGTNATNDTTQSWFSAMPNMKSVYWFVASALGVVRILESDILSFLVQVSSYCGVKFKTCEENGT